MTTPEIILGVVVTIAAYIYKYFLGGGLTTQDLKSLVIPGLWAGCLASSFYLIKAARSLREQDIEALKSWKPAIAEADYLRPGMPPRRSLAITTTLFVICFVSIIVLTALMGTQAVSPTSIAPILDVGDTFRSAYTSVGQALGKPKGHVLPGGNAYYAAMEHGTELWVQATGTMWFIHDDGKAVDKWVEYDECGAVKKYIDKDLRGKHFHPPPGRLSPYGGMGCLWDKDPKWKTRTGFVRWHNIYDRDFVSYQQFENGIIVGPFSRNENSDRWADYLIFNDDQAPALFDYQISKGHLSKYYDGNDVGCIQPMQKGWCQNSDPHDAH